MTDRQPDRPRRARSTSRGVKVAERSARIFITAGGLGTIAAVGLIFAFLVWVVLPIFLGAKVEEPRALSPGAERGAEPVRLLFDEHRLLTGTVYADGWVRVHRADGGALVEERELFPGREPRASSFSLDNDACAFGFADGTVLAGRLGFRSRFLPDGLEALEELQPGDQASYEDPRSGERGVVECTPEGQLRFSFLEARMEDDFDVEGGPSIALIDFLEAQDSSALCYLTVEGELDLIRRSERVNFMTEEITRSYEHLELPYEPRPGGEPPTRLLLARAAAGAYLAWPDGRLQRIDCRPAVEPAVVETLDLVEDDSGDLTALSFLVGHKTLVSGDSHGRVRAWFAIKPENAQTADGAILVQAHELQASEHAVTSLAPSPRSRLLGAGYADGEFRLYHVTSQMLLGECASGGGGALELLAIAPKEDAVLALGTDGLWAADIDRRYPEANFAALFEKVWYEGDSEPTYVWQSSSATDAFEPKLSLVPLVFGTIKATFYTMLFGVPLALLAAVYTSEFLSPRYRNRIKSIIEMMASLPSVVLGFLAAIIIAPFVQQVVPAVLACFLTIPLAYLLGGYGWQLLPPLRQRELAGVPRTLLMILALPLGVGAAFLLGPWLAELLFGGDVMAWLDGQGGSGTGGWLLLLLPVSLISVSVLAGRIVSPWLREVAGGWSAQRLARADLLKFTGCLLVGTGLAAAAALLLDASGLDPRGSFVGTYVQRNALIVGFVMGFAVIPIIYTIAEDALSSVPEHLRLASLGAGATPWQTAVRIIIPTAMSGLFSAVMIGLGRAVGETMIVLMATGNTAVMDWNVFNGFRTLSANIAVELPEAARNSTHYRTLFLAALTLFAMTFVLNTLAEAVRQRFRKRAFEL